MRDGFDPEALLLSYCAGELTPGEERALFEAAAADQDLFNQLTEAERLRHGPRQQRPSRAAEQEQRCGSSADVDQHQSSGRAAGHPVSLHQASVSFPEHVVDVAEHVLVRQPRC